MYNDYNADMLVRLNGADYCTIPAQTLQTIDDISLGSTLSFTLTGEEVFSPYDYQLIYDYDSICPILDLSEDAELAVSAVLQDELTTAPLTGEDSGLLGGFDRLLLANGWTVQTALCTLVLTVAHAPCSTTCLTILRETRSAKWTLAAVLIPAGVGLALCILIHCMFTPTG